MADNNVTLVGNLTRDPELRFTSGGRGVASFGLAVNRRYQVNGEWKDDTSYFNVVAWGQLGENVASTLTKGMRVVVSGRLEQRSWDDQKTGDKRTAIEINADEVGPSLRWATASVDRNPRNDGAGGYTPRSNGSSSQADPMSDIDGAFAAGDDNPFS
jgi:single-strand DNA-binding protein